MTLKSATKQNRQLSCKGGLNLQPFDVVVGCRSSRYPWRRGSAGPSCSCTFPCACSRATRKRNGGSRQTATHFKPWGTTQSTQEGHGGRCLYLLVFHMRGVAKSFPLSAEEICHSMTPINMREVMVGFAVFTKLLFVFVFLFFFWASLGTAKWSLDWPSRSLYHYKMHMHIRGKHGPVLHVYFLDLVSFQEKWDTKFLLWTISAWTGFSSPAIKAENRSKSTRRSNTVVW